MHSVRVLYDVPNWAYFQVAEALRKYAPGDFDVTARQWPDTAKHALDATLGPEPPDFVIVNQFRHVPRVRAYVAERGWPSRIVCFWNVGWPRRTEFLAGVLAAADGVIFINEEYWHNIGRLPNAVCIPHGADLDVFAPRLPVAHRPRRVLWLGSEVNRTLKGYDAIVDPLEARLREAGFECDFRLLDSNAGGPLDTAEMSDWYNSGRIILCASDCEGTPNVVLEAAACGCVPVSTRVGNMPELIRHGENGLLVERSVDAFEAAVHAADSRCEALSDAILRDIRAWGWDVLGPRVFEFLHDIAGRGPRTAPRLASAGRRAAAKTVVSGRADAPDISGDVTVFVTTVGDPTYEACLRLLDLQDCRFGLRIIRDVAPLSAAFQRMLDECETPYYVQVDEDMLLYPHAVRTLYEGIHDQPEVTAIHVAPLFDTHVRMTIYGVKIFRHAIVRRYPFADTEGCDVDQNERLKADGFAVSLAGPTGGDRPCESTLGLHGTFFAPKEAFYRYLNLSTKTRRRQRITGWEDLPFMLAQRVSEECSSQNAYALLGAMAGLVVPLADAAAEKDFRMQGRSKGYRALTQFVASVSDSV